MRLKNLKKMTRIKTANENEYKLLVEMLYKAGYQWLKDPAEYNNNPEYRNRNGILAGSETKLMTYDSAPGNGKPLKKVLKLEPGDTVKVRDAVGTSDYPGDRSFAGAVSKIVDISDEGNYYLEIDPTVAWRKKSLEIVPELCLEQTADKNTEQTSAEEKPVKNQLYETRKRLKELKQIGNSIPKDYASQDMYMADLKAAEEAVERAERDVAQEMEMEL